MQMLYILLWVIGFTNSQKISESIFRDSCVHVKFETVKGMRIRVTWKRVYQKHTLLYA